MKQDGCNGKTESQTAAMLCEKKVRCVSPRDHIPSQLGCLASKASLGLTLMHLATSPKCRGKRRHSRQHGGEREKSHCFPDKSTSPVPSVKLSVLSLLFTPFSSGSQAKHPVLGGFKV